MIPEEPARRGSNISVSSCFCGPTDKYIDVSSPPKKRTPTKYTLKSYGSISSTLSHTCGHGLYEAIWKKGPPKVGVGANRPRVQRRVSRNRSFYSGAAFAPKSDAPPAGTRNTSDTSSDTLTTTCPAYPQTRNATQTGSASPQPNTSPQTTRPVSQKEPPSKNACTQPYSGSVKPTVFQPRL
jgi:hypothetical protein